MLPPRPPEPRPPEPPHLNLPPAESESEPPVPKHPKPPRIGKTPRPPEPPRMAELPHVQEPIAPAADIPFSARQRWSGAYVCGQGVTGLQLRITAVRGEDVDAVFEFLHDESGVSGSYRVTGHYESAHQRLSLSPVAWIRQPPSYEMVGLTGTVTNHHVFAGTIQNRACSNFSVTLD